MYINNHIDFNYLKESIIKNTDAEIAKSKNTLKNEVVTGVCLRNIQSFVEQFIILSPENDKYKTHLEKEIIASLNGIINDKTSTNNETSTNLCHLYQLKSGLIILNEEFTTTSNGLGDIKENKETTKQILDCFENTLKKIDAEITSRTEGKTEERLADELAISKVALDGELDHMKKLREIKLILTQKEIDQVAQNVIKAIPTFLHEVRDADLNADIAAVLNHCKVSNNLNSDELALQKTLTSIGSEADIKVPDREKLLKQFKDIEALKGHSERREELIQLSKCLFNSDVLLAYKDLQQEEAKFRSVQDEINLERKKIESSATVTDWFNSWSRTSTGKETTSTEPKISELLKRLWTHENNIKKIKSELKLELESDKSKSNESDDGDIWYNVDEQITMENVDAKNSPDASPPLVDSPPLPSTTLNKNMRKLINFTINEIEKYKEIIEQINAMTNEKSKETQDFLEKVNRFIKSFEDDIEFYYSLI